MLLSNMNTSADPCDDFYEYACGNFKRNHKIPDDKGMLDAFDLVSDKVQKLLESELSKEGPADEASPLKFIRQFFQRCSDEGKCM